MIISEDMEQTLLFDWIRLHPDIAPYCIHIANQRQTSIVMGKKLKCMGVMAGVSDVFIAIPKNGFSGMWLELKTKTGRATPIQKDFLTRMEVAGYKSVIANGFDSARLEIIQYLGL